VLNTTKHASLLPVCLRKASKIRGQIFQYIALPEKNIDCDELGTYRRTKKTN
jgi:hypothetical protein